MRREAKDVSSASVDIVQPVQCLARSKPGLQPNRGCELLYTTRHGDTMAQHKEGQCAIQRRKLWSAMANLTSCKETLDTVQLNSHLFS